MFYNAALSDMPSEPTRYNKLRVALMKKGIAGRLTAPVGRRPETQKRLIK